MKRPVWVKAVILLSMFSSKHSLAVLQSAVWLLSILLFFFYLRQRLATFSTAYVVSVTLSSFLSFAAIIYGYVFLYNRFHYRKKRMLLIVLWVVVLFAAVAALRMYTEATVITRYTKQTSIFFFGKVHWSYTVISCFFALIVGMLLKSFAEAIKLKQRQAAILQKQLETELKQLKAHVQPHFLFNSLNNLYFDTYKTLPNVADRIARLSDIMRYFIEETPRETVQLSTETTFIESYIELEKVRLHTPVDIDMEVTADLSTRVPPMLLIPLVENVFKHGIQNNGTRNKVMIRLHQQEGRIHFLVRNTAAPQQTESLRTGTGLPNLKERLGLLFKNDYSLDVKRMGDQFIAELQFPVA
jgi:sensor histidine kinase YesM